MHQPASATTRLSRSHSRFNPLTGGWILNSPHRLQRPWLGSEEITPAHGGQPYDPDCYLCPGNVRANGETNPAYTSVFVFDNDFPALQAQANDTVATSHPLFQLRAEPGHCKVICFSPQHDLTLAQLAPDQVRIVVAAWVDIQMELAQDPGIGYVQIFENKGEIMGCSNPHPHCQVWTTRHIPTEPNTENAQQGTYFKRTQSVLLLDYLKQELAAGERIVAQNEDWVVLVPFWAVWPFETLLLPRHSVQSLSQLSRDQQAALADLMLALLERYDRLFSVSMPYSMGWHGAPCIKAASQQPHWQVHAHYYPPLLRSATVRKFLVGYEMLAQPQRDISPEQAAQRLRDA